MKKIKMKKINLNKKQIYYIAAHIEERQRDIYPDPRDMDYIVCIDEMIEEAIKEWNEGLEIEAWYNGTF